MIVLAHWRAQSFYQEMYTDLYDFCFCLSSKIKNANEPPCYSASQPSTVDTAIPPSLQRLYDACGRVMDALVKENPPKPHGNPNLAQIIVSAEFLGPSYQYSRGLSVYFPWTKPVGDRRIMDEYKRYKFHQDLSKDEHGSWLDFLNAYFHETQRCPSSQEADHRRYLPNLRNAQELREQCCHDPKCPPLPQPVIPPDPCAPPQAQQTQPPPTPSPCQKEQEERELREDIANLIYGDGSLGDYELAGNDDKSGPRDPTGGSDCSCPSIKNYPRDTRARRERIEKAVGGKGQSRVEVTQASFL